MVRPDAAPTVAVALGGTTWEPELVAALRHPAVGLEVARRCFEMVDLLAFCTVTRVDGVIVNGSAPGVDAAGIAALHDCGVWVVAVVDDEAGAAHAGHCGADATVIMGADACAAVAARLGRHARALLAAVAETGDSSLEQSAAGAGASNGAVVGVWGPVGSSGRSTVALAIADELARAGTSAALVDADPHGACLDQLACIPGAAASLVWAQRQAAQGLLTRRMLLEAMPVTDSGVRVLPGASDNNPLRPHLWPLVMTQLRAATQAVVVDLGGHEPIEPDAAVSCPTVQAALASDVLLTVGACDPVALARLARFLDALARVEVVGPRHVVAVTGLPQHDRAAPSFIAGLIGRRVDALGADLAFVDHDADACMRARLRGMTLAKAAPRSQIRRDLRALAGHVIRIAA